VPGVVRFGELDAVAFADAGALERDERSRQHRAHLREQGGDAVAVADRDHHQRHVRVAGGEARALPLPVGSAVDAQQDGRAGDAALMKQFNERPVCRPPADAVVAA
jgi:hypothetical protein